MVRLSLVERDADWLASGLLTARSYCGMARSAYSRSIECGMGMAMRGRGSVGNQLILSYPSSLVSVSPSSAAKILDWR